MFIVNIANKRGKAKIKMNARRRVEISKRRAEKKRLTSERNKKYNLKGKNVN